MKGKMKFTALLLTLVMVMGLFAGCGKKDAADTTNDKAGGEQKKTEDQAKQ